MVGHFLDILGVADLVLGIDHEDRAALDAKLFNQGAVVLAEGSVLMVREHFYAVDSERAAPPLLRKWQVHADRNDIDARKMDDLFVELLRLSVANGCVERRD